MARVKRKTSAERRRERRAAEWATAGYRLHAAAEQYMLALAQAEHREREPEGVVCERCGLEQPYHTAEGPEDVSVCPGPLGLGCGHELAVTDEAWQLDYAA